MHNNTTLSTRELLAPAGGPSQLEACVRYGADAVYLAADRFGMRHRADNFSLEQIPEAVAFAHAAGVRVFAALNTLMHAEDIAALPAYFEALAAAQIDAFIVSDLGAFALAQKHAPKVELHVSTQASVANAEAARMWHNLGASRVVCAREMSVEDIANLRADAPRDLEIEAFVHGAMCMAVSGRCLISSAMADRSANKGHCTQPCRWNYALVEEKRPGQYFPIEQDTRGAYLMNAQDLNMLEHLNDLAEAGVDSFKIEGRNKRAFYVASVVHAYRAVLDGADPALIYPELLAISHRPYGTGFFYGQPDQAHERDGYVKECVHVATVRDCEPIEDDQWLIEVTCHNRFRQGETLQALSPRSPIAQLVVRDLKWIQRAKNHDFYLEPAVVEVGNRASEIYTFTSEIPLQAGDYLSIRIEEG